MPRLLLPFLLLAAVPAGADWPHYAGGPESTRYSPLKQITPANVGSLAVAWSYDTGDAFKGSEMQCQPVVAHGVLYASSPKLRVFALDAATGAPKWTFDPFEGSKTSRWTRIRGLMYRERGDERRIYFGARHWLYALDANTGKPVASFGDHGRIDLRLGFEGRDPAGVSIRVNTPGVFYGDLMILGSVVPEGLPSAPGDIRAFDVNTGRQKWAFHTIPHPGEVGYDTWPKDAWKYIGGANAWSGLSLDEKRGLVFAATGSAAYDFYGANRAGDNLFANTILCLKAATGERVWHFQAVKHDVWDRDFPAAPALITITKDGQRRDVIAQIAKNGRTYVLDRETGEPVFPMEELRVPASDVPGEVLATTQRLPLLPPPFARPRFTEDLVTTRTPAAEQAVREEWRKLRTGGEFDPPSLQGTVLFPGMDGGGEWGGVAFDPGSGLLYVNANEMAWRIKLAERKLPEGKPTSGKALYQTYCASCHRADLKGSPPEMPSLVGIGARSSVDDVAAVVSEGGGRMPAFKEIHGGGAPRDRGVRRERHVGDGRRRQANALRHAVLDGRLHALHRSRRLPRDQAPLGNADRDRHEPRGDRVAGTARRAARLRRCQLRQRELRRAGGDRERPPLHRRDRARQEVPRLRRRDRQAAVGDDAPRGGQRDARGLRGERPAVRRDRRRRRQVGRSLGRQLRRLRAAGGRPIG